MKVTNRLQSITMLMTVGYHINVQLSISRLQTGYSCYTCVNKGSGGRQGFSQLLAGAMLVRVRGEQSSGRDAAAGNDIIASSALRCVRPARAFTYGGVH